MPRAAIGNRQIATDPDDDPFALSSRLVAAPERSFHLA
jgi:hypothetical protein